MGSRLSLQTLLEDTLGSNNVYFQPPESLSLSYPCIVYNRSDIDARFADNLPYSHTNEYTLTVIDHNPDSDIPMAVAKLPQCVMENHFTSDQLHHDVFKIIF